MLPQLRIFPSLYNHDPSQVLERGKNPGSTHPSHLGIQQHGQRDQPPLLKSLLGEGRQDEAGLVDIGVVVAAQALLFLGAPRAQGLLDVASGLLAADHEADLARGIGGDGSVGVLGHGEHLATVLLELRDEREVEPLVLSCE